MENKSNREYRSMMLSVAPQEDEQEESYIVEGYATTFDRAYNLYKDDYIEVNEVISNNAFDRCDMSDVIMQYDHQGRVFARTRNNTLQLSTDEIGLKVVANLGGTDEGKKLYHDIKGGYIDRMSFGFIIDEESETRESVNDRAIYTRTIKSISKLFDVSAVSIPANDTTSIHARNYVNGVIDKDSLERKRKAEIEAYSIEVRTLSIDEIEERISQVQDDERLNILNSRKEELRKDFEAQKELRNKVATGEIKTTKLEKPKENRNMELTRENYLQSAEYRSAYLKTLQGKPLNEEERGAFALAEAEAVLPTQLQNTILAKVKDYAPILNEVTLLNVNGNVTYAVEGDNGEAVEHDENATIALATDTLVKVELTTHEVVKLIQISASVKQMSIPAFEAWIVAQLAEAIAMKIEKMIFANILATGNKTTGEVNATNILALFASLKAGYAREAKVYMSRNTLYTKVMNLQDKAKNDMVVFENGTYKLYGIEIECTDSVGASIVLGAPRKFVANLAEQINVKSAFDINTNSYKYLGVALFDGKLALAEAFQILGA